MNRQRGVSSLALVLLLLVPGSLLLQGVNQQLSCFSARVAVETQALQHQAQVYSAMEWGKMLPWSGQTETQCRYYGMENIPVCMRMLSENRVLLIASWQGMTVWRQGENVAGERVFSAHGWSDFCPLKEVALCRLP